MYICKLKCGNLNYNKYDKITEREGEINEASLFEGLRLLALFSTLSHSRKMKIEKLPVIGERGQGTGWGETESDG